MIRRCAGGSSLDSCFSAAAVNLTAQTKALLYLIERVSASPAFPRVQHGLIVGCILQVLRHRRAHEGSFGLASTFGVFVKGRFQFRGEFYF